MSRGREGTSPLGQGKHQGVVLMQGNGRRTRKVRKNVDSLSRKEKRRNKLLREKKQRERDKREMLIDVN